MPLQSNVDVPHIIKYMGSKKNLIDFVVEGINEVYVEGAHVCDLFAGTAVLSGVLRNQATVISNDIQSYSSVLAKTYLESYPWNEHPGILEHIVDLANDRVRRFKNEYPQLVFNYNREFTLTEFNELEKSQQDLINFNFGAQPNHLFAKNYSGTYWSYEQCLWIDAIRSIAEDEYINSPFYNAIISSLMFAMSYNSQSTGHYAQYRDATNMSSMNDILIYRRKEILPFFIRKFEELRDTLNINQFEYQVTAQDYRECLNNIPHNTVVYADPPYAFVHYSRFYHVIETLVRYDYPEVLHKGRYRTDRHQSPFCIRTQVKGAFREMFSKVFQRESHLVLSYSDTGMITLEELVELAREEFAERFYEVNIRFQDYLHSTMGRREDKNRNVQECLIIARRRA
ncbi:hypothetical protein GE107_21520 [Cohnella sp. CFH 77786]|uniref:DNA adenine methylase n=1 Tax=Cohnella sp. CFH 77786 TaxID=2662265 RepID=UPI001C6097D1|nr:DNA adenine methylase [Cohnella sp. CFH 77786]MBW5448630.1 hypothetical protein [Cohnella sp. CFH 77786]